MLRLYYNPGSCSLAAHAALEASGLPYRAERVDLSAGANDDRRYRAINPWGRVPALAIDGNVLTENVAILQYLADAMPAPRMLPEPGTLAFARATEWLALLAGTVHIAFRPLFRPERLARTEAGLRDVRETGLVALGQTLSRLETRFGAGPYALGDSCTFCDFYLFVFVLWMQRPALDGQFPALPGLAAFGKRLADHPAVAAAMVAEGLHYQS